MADLEYRELAAQEITRELLRAFIRRQVVTHCWRKVDGRWVIKPDPFIDDWSEPDYSDRAASMRQTVEKGGMLYGALQNGKLKGFVSVEAAPLGSSGQYLDLSRIHVSQELRGQGIGSILFAYAKAWAKAHGAQKLYISAHSAVESQGFYKKMGCVEAEEYSAAHVAEEPFDRQLECEL